MAEEFAATVEVCKLGSGGFLRTFYSLMASHVESPDSRARDIAVDLVEKKIGRTLMFSDKAGMAKYETVRKQVCSDIAVPYEREIVSLAFREQCLHVQKELKLRKEFRDVAIQRIIKAG